jgi:putative transposase
MEQSKRKPSPTDVTEEEWGLVEPLVPPVKPGGRPARGSRRAIVKAVSSVVQSGGAWRRRPPARPPWQTVSYSFGRWRHEGTWEALQGRVREPVRRRAGREPPPRAGRLESPSVQTTEQGGLAAATGANR